MPHAHALLTAAFYLPIRFVFLHSTDLIRLSAHFYYFFYVCPFTLEGKRAGIVLNAVCKVFRMAISIYWAFKNISCIKERIKKINRIQIFDEGTFKNHFDSSSALL